MIKLKSEGKVTRLSELADLIQYGYTSKSSSSIRGPKYLRITDIQNDHVEWKRVPHVRADSIALARYRLRPGDIVFARSGATVGKSFLIEDDPGEAVFASYLIRVRCAPGRLDPRYAALFFKSETYWQQIRDGSTGTGQPNFNGTKLGDLCVPQCSVGEQRGVVASVAPLLKRTKSARVELDRIPRLIERYKHAVLSNAFRGILTKDDPAKWKTTTLGEVLAAIEAGKNIRCEERPPRAGERGIVKISSVTWGEFDPSASKTAAPSAILDGKTLIQSGDFLISRANTLELVGACVVVDTLDTQNLYLSDKVLRLRFKQPIEKWVMYFLRSEDGRQQIQELATGNQRSMRNISQSTLRTIRLPLPPREIRERILVAVEKALSAITVTSAESKRAADLLDRLEQVTLTKAFRGELFNVHQMTTAETAAS